MTDNSTIDYVYIAEQKRLSTLEQRKVDVISHLLEQKASYTANHLKTIAQIDLDIQSITTATILRDVDKFTQILGTPTARASW